mmetsp:Transcript_25254/g.30779  ORF Transcript_25254/g.30779 Transcript_25254/m.30779 type:complete len:219 (-) Transcript_25254:330-986(-)
MVFQLHRLRAEALGLACINGCFQLIVRHPEGIQETLNPENCSPLGLVRDLILLRERHDAVVDILLLSIAVSVVTTSVLFVPFAGWQLKRFLLLVALNIFVIVLAQLVATELFVGKGRGHGNVTPLFLQEKSIICIREVLLHVDEVVPNGWNWSSFVHHTGRRRRWENSRLLIGIAQCLPLILKDLKCNNARAIIVRPHRVLGHSALHVLFIQHGDVVH